MQFQFISMLFFNTNVMYMTQKKHTTELTQFSQVTNRL